uniref:Uncharacterized protein n=1 Tax=Grammatophora oceanica TaxID=210454 RepID=A0A7S1V7Q1_9STRA|mmetsp:Transcript_38892/g.57827  ORF Transcript_38892/g.57827 Transcript_38892/m.57827 type:complete len:243 (+) Transcript_38892:95-823(+)
MRKALFTAVCFYGAATRSVGGLSNSYPRSVGVRTKMDTSSSFEPSATTPLKAKCEICPETTREDPDLDRREALFAMLGWAAAVVLPPSAFAAAGAEAKIVIPDVYGAMSDRINRQCLVETLGNRECLVYMDDANKVYQGADSKVLLERIEKASAALATVPQLVEDKKWSKVTGVLTGPLGQLTATMNQLVKLSEKPIAADLAKKTKLDLFAMGAAADKKQGKPILDAHEKATNDLVAFLEAL